MSSKVDVVNNLVKVYRALAAFPRIEGGRILTKQNNPDVIQVSSLWNQIKIEEGEIIKFQKTFFINAASSNVIFQSSPSDVSTEELSRTSNSEKFSCIVRRSKQENKKKQFIEIWTQNGMFKTFDTSVFDVHGDIYSDGEFGTLEWSPNEEMVLYIAEKKSKKAEPFYPQKHSDSGDDKDDKASSVGEEYTYKPDWGEQLVDKHQPVAVICNITSEKIDVLKGIPPNFSPGQLLWSKDGSGIFGVVMENEPRRLGLIYCTNRLSYIFQLSLNGEFKILSDEKKSVRSPRLSLDGKSLFWLQRPFGGVHNGCQELVKLDLATKKKEILINVVGSAGSGSFPGLFLHHLPKRCFSKDGTKLFFSSFNKLKNCSYYLDLGTKQVHLLETGDGSSTILDVHDDIILIACGSLQQTHSLKISKSISKIEWIPVTKSEMVCKNSTLKELEFESKTGGHKFTYYNALFYGPSAPSAPNQKVPLILYPHGGPHSASVNDFAFDPNFLVSIGYAVLLVNYRGSTGAGQDGIDFLPGKIGDTDVKDCHEAVLRVLKDIPYLDEKNVFLKGSSHGGFLVGHLSAQYPDFYRAVVSGNPVTDVSAMYFSSDIPDWATSECGLNFDESKPLTLEQINKMVASSPIQLSNKIKAPTLLLIGKKDLRVPCHEGIRMYNALKARNVKVRLNLYDDNHTLGKVTNQLDCLINTALWFGENKA